MNRELPGDEVLQEVFKKISDHGRLSCILLDKSYKLSTQHATPTFFRALKSRRATWWTAFQGCTKYTHHGGRGL